MEGKQVKRERPKSRKRLILALFLGLIVIGAGVGGYFIYKNRISADTPTGISTHFTVAINNFTASGVDQYSQLLGSAFRCQEVNVNLTNLPSTDTNSSVSTLINKYRTNIANEIVRANTSADIHWVYNEDAYNAAMTQCSTRADKTGCKSDLYHKFIVSTIKAACDKNQEATAAAKAPATTGGGSSQPLR